MIFDNLHLTATIGRNVGRVPMDAARWEYFQRSVEGELRDAGEDLAHHDAVPYVDQWCATTGEWGGTPEDNAHIIFTVSLREGIGARYVARVLRRLRVRIAVLAREYGQDAIALSYAVPGHESGAGLVGALAPEVRS